MTPEEIRAEKRKKEIEALEKKEKTECKRLTQKHKIRYFLKNGFGSHEKMLTAKKQWREDLSKTRTLDQEKKAAVEAKYAAPSQDQE